MHFLSWFQVHCSRDDRYSPLNIIQLTRSERQLLSNFSIWTPCKFKAIYYFRIGQTSLGVHNGHFWLSFSELAFYFTVCMLGLGAGGGVGFTGIVWVAFKIVQVYKYYFVMMCMRSYFNHNEVLDEYVLENLL